MCIDEEEATQTPAHSLSAPPCSFLFLSAALSLKCLFNQHGTCFRIKRGALVTANGSVSASDALSGIPLSPPANALQISYISQTISPQLDVYWKITDFPRAMLVPDLGGEAVAHIIDLNYNWSPVSVYAFIYVPFALKYKSLCFCLQSGSCSDASLEGYKRVYLTRDPSPPV